MNLMINGDAIWMYGIIPLVGVILSFTGAYGFNYLVGEYYARQQLKNGDA